MLVNQFGHLLVAAVRRFLAEDCMLFGAALAYYAIFSLAPVLVIVMAVSGLCTTPGPPRAMCSPNSPALSEQTERR